MKYAKFINSPLYILRDAKFNGKGNKIDWQYLGFVPGLVMKKQLQYRDPADNWVQILPVSAEPKFNAFISTIQTDLDEFEGTVELVDQAEYDACKIVHDDWRAAQKAAQS